MTETPTFGVTGDQSVSEGGASIYDSFREELNKAVDMEPVTLSVPNRPNMQVRFDTDIPFDLFEQWTKRATDRKDRFSPLKFAFMVLSNKCTGIIYEGEEMEDSEGQPFTFAHAEFRKMCGAMDTQGAIRRIYGADGHIISTSGAIMEKAGYEDIDLESGDNPLSMP